jgi:hypothetical protein
MRGKIKHLVALTVGIGYQHEVIKKSTAAF